ncbi:vegetative cell wall protein gp1 isoform X2 [Andrographis paniculata]|uniref:vegetative cell wall protein gp1 isoform X2 n=1 Tax=Andrographis paniculata TaxID=175694 RepID=UPI0021E9632B|nr:vegetative cell wall protein gp1 isoform X2 [Andrographis paniculata]XP_051146568.1 vegetative cell wall protein gp1 isoform X2 [Andrographis paniculata]
MLPRLEQNENLSTYAMRMRWMLMVAVAMAMAVAEATPPGIAKNPSNAACLDKKYKLCYNLVHVCPKFCPDSCTVECVSCKPICSGASSPGDAPPPSDGDGKGGKPPKSGDDSPPPSDGDGKGGKPPKSGDDSPPPSDGDGKGGKPPKSGPPGSESPPPPVDTSPPLPPQTPPTTPQPSPPTPTPVPTTPPSSPPPSIPSVPSPSPPQTPPTTPQPSPPTPTPSPTTPQPSPPTPTPSPTTPQPSPPTPTPSPTTPPSSPPPSSPPPPSIPSTPSPSPPQTPPTTPQPSPPTPTPSPTTPPSSTPPQTPPTTPQPSPTPPTVPSTPTPPSPLSPPSTPTPPSPLSPPTQSPPPPQDSSDSAGAKRKRCRNINYPQCYNLEHTCPASCPHTCEIDCVSCKPVCKCDRPGAVCQDPRFIGGDGITFYFHGKKDRDFCLVTDPNLHINAHFIGRRNQFMKRDFTWVQSIGILFGRHRLFVGALKTAVWDDAVDRLSLAFDGEPILLPAVAGSTWQPSDFPSATVKRDSDANSVTLRVDGLFEISATAVPITAQESAVHNYGITEEDTFAHIELGFKFFALSGKVNGILGQTYGSNYVSRVKMGVPMPVLGGEREFAVSGLFAADCEASQFLGGEITAAK